MTWARTCGKILGTIALVVLPLGYANEAAPGPAAAQPLTGELILFHAGSLAVPFREVTAQFQRQHPEVRVKAEAAGSRATARKVSDLERRCDVLASADYLVIDNLLIPEHADFNVRFATNEMAIAYTKDSRLHDQLTAENWPEILMHAEVRFGRANPNSDPCGYRTVILFQLAERFFKQPGLAARLTRQHGARFIRPKETDLLALLEVGEIDYLFIYRSVAIQHGLELLRLPDQLNLRDPALADLYATASVRITGKKPGEWLVRTGAPIVYGLTIPKNAPHRQTALAYVQFLLSPEGRAIMERNGQGGLEPALGAEAANLPALLQPYCQLGIP